MKDLAEIERLRECADIRTDVIIAAGKRIERLEAALREIRDDCDCAIHVERAHAALEPVRYNNWEPEK
jgi:hypothetical protein